MQKIKKKVIGSIICMLLIAVTILPVTGTINNVDVIENQTRSDEWAMFLHDPERTGSTTSIAPQTNNIRWIFDVPPGSVCDPLTDCSPAVVDRKVYFSTFNEYFFCIDADTGEELWRFYDDGFGGCPPAVYEDKVYVASTYDYFYCLDANTGNEIWRFYKGYRFSHPSPVIVDDKVYFAHSQSGSGSGDACLYCLDADTGSKFWEYNMGYFQVSSPTVYDGKVYIGSEDHKLYCLDADNGNVLWDFDTSFGVISTPTIFDGKLYFGSDALYCLNADNGNQIWEYTTGGRVISSPGVAHGNIYFLAEFGSVHCLDAYNGSEIWNYPTGTGGASPIVADGNVYIGIWESDKLLCLDAITGEKIWEYGMNAYPFWTCSPAVAYGRLYMSSGLSNKLYCFEDLSQPPNNPTITGTTMGYIDCSYNFDIVTTDPDGDDVRYFIDWDDGNNTGWIGFYPSGEAITVSHTWNEPGVYTIKAKAEDTHGMISGWGEHTIEIIDGPVLEIQVIKGGLFKVSTVVKNIGVAEATNVSWSIILDGGFILFGRETTGTTENILPGEEISVNSDLILGIGSTTVTVTTTTPLGVSDTRTTKAFVFLSFIIMKATL